MACYNISEILLPVINYVAIVIYVMVLDGCLILLYPPVGRFLKVSRIKEVVVLGFKKTENRPLILVKEFQRADRYNETSSKELGVSGSLTV